MEIFNVLKILIDKSVCEVVTCAEFSKISIEGKYYLLMNKAALEKTRQKLLTKQQELRAALNLDLQMEEHSEDESKDLLDAAATYTNRELVARQMDQYRQLLVDVEDALKRIDDGTYGVCLGSGEKIPDKRLEAVPWARYTIDYQEKLEKGLVSE